MHDMILYVENSKVHACVCVCTQLLGLINEFSMVIRIQINIKTMFYSYMPAMNNLKMKLQK